MTAPARNAFRLSLVALCAASAFPNVQPKRGAADASSAPPEARLVGSVVLQEDDKSLVGEPSGFAALPDGSFYVADARSATLHHYSATGRLIANIGRRGGGPDEWRWGPSTLALDGDSLLIVGDGPRVVALALPRANVRWERRKPTVPSIAIRANGGRVFFNRVDAKARTTVSAIRGADDAAVDGGPYPEQLNASPLIGELFSAMALGALGSDSVAVAIQSSNYLFIGRFPAGPFDSVAIPVVTRRGALPDLLSRVDEKIPSTIERVLYKPSYPIGVHRLPGSRVLAVAFIDMAMQAGRKTGTLTVSLVDIGRRRACADATVPVPSDPLPQVAFRGDTVMVISQDEDAANKSRTIIRKFVIATGSCVWSASR